MAYDKDAERNHKRRADPDLLIRPVERRDDKPKFRPGYRAQTQDSGGRVNPAKGPAR